MWVTQGLRAQHAMHPGVAEGARLVRAEGQREGQLGDEATWPESLRAFLRNHCRDLTLTLCETASHQRVLSTEVTSPD